MLILLWACAVCAACPYSAGRAVCAECTARAARAPPRQARPAWQNIKLGQLAQRSGRGKAARTACAASASCAAKSVGRAARGAHRDRARGVRGHMRALTYPFAEGGLSCPPHEAIMLVGRSWEIGMDTSPQHATTMQPPRGDLKASGVGVFH